MKRDQNFKMPSFVKKRLATIVDRDERNSYKRMMIGAIIHGEQMSVREKKSKGKSEE